MRPNTHPVLVPKREASVAPQKQAGSKTKAPNKGKYEHKGAKRQEAKKRRRKPSASVSGSSSGSSSSSRTTTSGSSSSSRTTTSGSSSSSRTTTSGSSSSYGPSSSSLSSSSRSRTAAASRKRANGYKGKKENYRSSYNKHARRSTRRSSRRSEVARRKPWEARVKSQRKRSVSTTRPQRQQRSKATTQKAVHPAARATTPRAHPTAPLASSTKAAASASASASAPSASMSSTTSTHDFRNLKEWDTQGTIRKHFFDKVPGCFVDDHMVKGFTEEQLPGKLDKPADYAKWLGLSERFSPAGRVYFNDNFVPYAIKKLTKEYGKEAVAAIKPDLTLAKVQPAVSGIAPTVDPYADAATDGGEDGKDGDTGDAPETSPYLAKVKAQQVTMNKETREHYRQLALKEADQRQLLMLLCGNVEAAMFVDKQGQVRAPQQIIEHTLFLLQPYRMGNTVVGEVMQWVNLSVNVAWKNGYTVVMLVTLAVSILFAIDFLRGLYLMMLRGDSGPSRFFHAAARGTANVLMRIVQYGWSFFCSFFSRKYLPRHRAKQLTQRDYNKWLRILTTTGFFGLCTYVIATYKPDYDKTRRLNLAQYAVQMVRDRYHQVQAMNYLAQLTPGIIGDDVSSGITERQLGLMEAIQKHFIDLDKEVDEMTNDRVSDLFNKFVTGDGELTDYKVDLGLMMMAKFQKSRTSEDTDVQAFRKQLMETYPQEMRCFHFLDAYGHPRNVTDICKVFFIYWKRSRESQLIPTIPHQGGPIAKWFDLTPTKFTPVARSFATQKAKRSSASEELMNTPDHQWWRQHAYLYKSAKNPISLRHVLQEKPASTTASLTPEELQQVKRHPGWTHRISKFTIAALVDKFQLSVNRLEDAYEQHVEVVTKGKGVKGVEWQTSREGMGFGLGTVKEAEAQRLEEEEEAKAGEDRRLVLVLARFLVVLLNLMLEGERRKNASDADQKIHNYTIESMPGDDCCLFHSIANGLSHFNARFCGLTEANRDQYQEMVRNDIAEYLGKHLGDLESNTGMTRRECLAYIKRVKYDHKFWGGGPELEVAAAFYGCQIHVYQRKDDGLTWDETRPIEFGDKSGDVIPVAYWGYHYDALVSDDMKNGQAVLKAKSAAKDAAKAAAAAVSAAKALGGAAPQLGPYGYKECLQFAEQWVQNKVVPGSVKQFLINESIDGKLKTAAFNEALKSVDGSGGEMFDKLVGASWGAFLGRLEGVGGVEAPGVGTEKAAGKKPWEDPNYIWYAQVGNEKGTKGTQILRVSLDDKDEFNPVEGFHTYSKVGKGLYLGKLELEEKELTKGDYFEFKLTYPGRDIVLSTIQKCDDVKKRLRGLKSVPVGATSSSPPPVPPPPRPVPTASSAPGVAAASGGPSSDNQINTLMDSAASALNLDNSTNDKEKYKYAHQFVKTHIRTWVNNNRKILFQEYIDIMDKFKLDNIAAIQVLCGSIPDINNPQSSWESALVGGNYNNKHTLNTVLFAIRTLFDAGEVDNLIKTVKLNTVDDAGQLDYTLLDNVEDPRFLYSVMCVLHQIGTGKERIEKYSYTCFSEDADEFFDFKSWDEDSNNKCYQEATKFMSQKKNKKFFIGKSIDDFDVIKKIIELVNDNIELVHKFADDFNYETT